jgi:hypothetical protein
MHFVERSTYSVEETLLKSHTPLLDFLAALMQGMVPGLAKGDR